MLAALEQRFGAKMPPLPEQEQEHQRRRPQQKRLRLRVECSACMQCPPPPTAAFPEGVPPACLGAARTTLRQLLESVAHVVVRRVAAQRRRLCAPPSGFPLLFGPRGTGRSTFAAAAARALREHPGALVHTVWVDCVALRGAKMEALQARLAAAWEEARRHAPSLLVLDNVDAVAPAVEGGDGGGSAADAQSAEIAAFIVDQLQAARSVGGVGGGRSGGGGGGSTTALEQVAATAGAVAALATATNAGAVHTSLIGSGVFDSPVPLPSYASVPARTGVLRGLCRQMHLRAAPDVDWADVAQLTEGYRPGDLRVLLHRAMLLATAADGTLCDADVRGALRGFTPAALRGAQLFKADVKWADVGGLHAARACLKETLELPMKYSRLYDRAPIRLPSGVLLYGPPGCGKTMLAGAVSAECGLNFISVKGPEVLNKYIGASEAAVRELFGRAAAAAPCVLFFDEFDAIAPRRGHDTTGVTDRVVNQLLTFLDGVEARKGVYVLAASSRPDLIDPALLRPGRLDKPLLIGFPDAAERLDILRSVCRDGKVEVDKEAAGALEGLANELELLTGADLQAVAFTAQLDAVSGGEKRKVTKDMLLKAARGARPSVSVKERARFNKIYREFAGEEDEAEKKARQDQERRQGMRTATA